MKQHALFIALAAAVMITNVDAQTIDAYKEGDGTEGKSGLLDPSRLTMNHSLSFGMSAAKGQSLQSQSLAGTMLQYKFSEPLTLNLDFGFPIHSTFRDDANLTKSNIESMNYFRNMPVSASLTWQPSPRLMMRLTVEKNTGATTSPYSNYFMPAPGLLGYW
ncbi:MAG: hypothetical protein GF344_18535 [Chitinivibrionales bacterium]|nr:hypothetical protein [Chitinivibrionales bacterium]MBD3358646.1 hypothetical protein [Chitinivibrionales bacterium]